MTSNRHPERRDQTGAGAENYEHLAPSLWNPLGNALASAADLLPGERVVDLFSGAGASALPAAQEVGPDGRVTAVDLSPARLGIAVEKARTLGLQNLETAVDDASAFSPAESPDAVLMGLGVFLVPDPLDLFRHIAGYLRPGGRLALSTWSQPGLEPLLEPFFRAAKRHNPALSTVERPRAYARIAEAGDGEVMAALLREAGFAEVESGEIRLHISLDGGLLWDFVLGTGLRTLLSADDDAINERIRDEFFAESLRNDLVDFPGTVDLHAARLAS